MTEGDSMADRKVTRKLTDVTYVISIVGPCGLCGEEFTAGHQHVAHYTEKVRGTATWYGAAHPLCWALDQKGA